MSTPHILIAPPATVSQQQRAELKGQCPCVLWMTGLSGAGKSTLAGSLDFRLTQMGHHCYVLDGDELRQGLNRDLGFSAADRRENIRRIGEVCRLFVHSGLIVIAAFISPFREDRCRARSLVADGEFIEIFLDTPLDVCEQRDVKGLYRRARHREIPDFTGISSPYEAPERPEIRIADLSPEEAASTVLDYLRQGGYINA